MPNIFPGFPSYPSYPAMPFSPTQLPGLPNMPSMPNTPGPGGVNGGASSVGNVFSNMLSKVSEEINAPNQLARDMVGGKKPYDPTELMISMMDAEHKLNTTVRVLNELTKGIKQLENLQI